MTQRREKGLVQKGKAIHENTNPKRKEHFPINKKGKRKKRNKKKQKNRRKATN